MVWGLCGWGREAQVEAPTSSLVKACKGLPRAAPLGTIPQRPHTTKAYFYDPPSDALLGVCLVGGSGGRVPHKPAPVGTPEAA